MNTEKQIAPLKLLRVASIVMLIGLFPLTVFPRHEAYSAEKETLKSETTTSIEFEGGWTGTKRSLSFIPFTAGVSDSTLYIRSSRPTVDIIIQIIDSTGQVVIRKEVSKDETSYISVDITHLLDGVYTLEIKGSQGGCVYGVFER